MLYLHCVTSHIVHVLHVVSGLRVGYSFHGKKGCAERLEEERRHPRALRGRRRSAMA